MRIDGDELAPGRSFALQLTGTHVLLLEWREESAVLSLECFALGGLARHVPARAGA